MTCDEGTDSKIELQMEVLTGEIGRPCQRCLKRNIGSMCYDEPKSTATVKKGSSHEKRKNSSSSCSESSEGSTIAFCCFSH